MKEPKEPDPRALLLPVEGKLGAMRKVEELIKELEHENKDWKFVVNGLRTYLFDHLFDISLHSKETLPTIFFYLNEATKRKKMSTQRACETFFDRFMHIIDRMNSGDERLRPVRKEFTDFFDGYLDTLLDLSREGYYLNSTIDVIKKFASKIHHIKEFNGYLSKLASLVFIQYKTYSNLSIKTTGDEITQVSSLSFAQGQCRELVRLLKMVSEDLYEEKIDSLEKEVNTDPEKFLESCISQCDITENLRTWGQISTTIVSEIEAGGILDEHATRELITFLVKKLNQGEDAGYQKNISRTLTSICSTLIERGHLDLFRSTIDLIMPVLYTEIRNKRNSASAFKRIYDLGRFVIISGNISLIDYFEDILIKNGFCFPEFGGIAQDWSVISNKTHIENIRTWLKLIELRPPLMKKLTASLIANLKLGGVFLKDTDVFQRDITTLLNSKYQDVFHLITSLAIVFPAFYHNIGATGNIRSYTESLDTNHEMNDLLHFIRKQVHVESSNRTVLLMQRTMQFWMTGEEETLRGLVPDEVADNLDHTYRLINLDKEEATAKIFQHLKTGFPEFSTMGFWDLLEELGRDRTMKYLSSADRDAVDTAQNQEACGLIEEYFRTRNPTEMTKILCYLRNEIGLDELDIEVWDRLYAMSDDDFRKIFDGLGGHNISKINIEKFVLFINVYRMLYDKYNFSEPRAVEKLEYYASQDFFKPPPGFFDKLKGEDQYLALEEIIKVQESLKSEILLSETKFEPLDTIEFKRHIAFGIPSMYGMYKEKKFDTLRVFFHMNLLRLRFFERIIEDLDIEQDQGMKYDRIKSVLKAFQRTYRINGLGNQEMDMVFELLDTPNLMTSQLEDILTQLLVIHGGIADTFNETFRYVCREAIKNIGEDRIKKQFPQFKEEEDAEIMIDRFLRDQIMQTPFLQLFDTFVIQLNRNLSRMMKGRNDEVCLNRAAVPSLSIYYKDKMFHLLESINDFNNEVTASIVAASIPIYNFQGPGWSKGKSSVIAPIWEVGNKAYGLLFMKKIDGTQIPDGIILASYLFRVFSTDVLDNEVLKNKLMAMLKTYMDSLTQNRFGNPDNPQLLSVRSGAVFFMPGVMDTITNIGLTQEVLDRYSKADEWFAYDCYRRFLQDLATSFYNVERSLFEHIITKTKKELNVDLKEKMTGQEMKHLAMRYKRVLEDQGHYIPEDPYEQLLYCMIAAYSSWDKATATDYRQIMGISPEWGTGIIIQKMILGNKSQADISGVVQSNYHGDEKISLFGEYKTRAQGYDLVSGVAEVFPISDDQKRVFPRYKDIPSLEEYRPEIYQMIYDRVWDIRDKYGNDVQIEFTVEDNKLFLLQVRGLIKHQFLKEQIDEEPAVLVEAYLGQGLAASGGAISGRIVFKTEDIEYMRKAYPSDKVILILPETNPEDVVGLKGSDGILTCLGGMTSHAVLQMRRFKKSGVSDFSALKIIHGENKAVITKNDGAIVEVGEGDFLTIDGSNGKVYLGQHKTTVKTVFEENEV